MPIHAVLDNDHKTYSLARKYIKALFSDKI